MTENKLINKGNILCKEGPEKGAKELLKKPKMLKKLVEIKPKDGRFSDNLMISMEFAVVLEAAAKRG